MKVSRRSWHYRYANWMIKVTSPTDHAYGTELSRYNDINLKDEYFGTVVEYLILFWYYIPRRCYWWFKHWWFEHEKRKDFKPKEKVEFVD